MSRNNNNDNSSSLMEEKIEVYTSDNYQDEDEQHPHRRSNNNNHVAIVTPSSTSSSAMIQSPDGKSFKMADKREEEQKPSNFCVSIFLCFQEMLFPKLTPLPWSTFFVLSIFVALPAAIYILTFTKMGFGLDTFYYLSENYEQYSIPLGFAIVALAITLYLTDCYYWESNLGGIMRRFLCVVILIGIIFLVLFMCGSHPYGPISLFIVMTSFWLAFVGMVFSHNSVITPKTYVTWLSGPLFFISMFIFVAWVIWTNMGDANEWNLVVSVGEAEATGCEPNFEDHPNCTSNQSDPNDPEPDVCFTVDLIEYTLSFEEEGCEETCTDVYSDCFNTFIVWVGPFLVSLGLLFLSFFATFLRSGGTGTSEEADIEKETSKFAKIWIFILFAIWVGASLAGAGAGISTTLAALTFASFIASAIFLSISYNQTERNHRMTQLKAHMMEKYGGQLDIFRGLLVVTCAPIFIIYFVTAMLKQQLRNMNCCHYAKPPNDTASLRNIGGQGMVTIEARRLYREYLSWNRTKVFTYAIYWGLLFMIMNVVVSQFTIVFLSWLIEETSDMNLGLVTAILIGVGLVMFLLPPVPGVPIYLTLGIVILPIGRDMMGLIGSMLYCLVVSILLKLFACTLQQKMIGEMLKGKVGVRQFVGINSNLIRSMKLVLREPGLSLPKVCILIGGPDWPTSVLCGIMDLPLLPILVGTLPVIFLIAPTMLTGAFTYMGSLRDENDQPEFPWAGTVATIFAAITAIVQFGSMVFAAYYLEQAISNNKEEIDAMPYDEEVRIADEKNEENIRKYEQVSKWEVLPIWAKILMIISLSCMIVSCYLVTLFLSECFAEYQLTDTIDTHLDGDWTNIVKPLGAVAIILLLISCVLLEIFKCWAKAMARKL